MTYAKIALVASAFMITAPVFAQTAGQTPIGAEPSREQRNGLNPLASSNSHAGAGKVDPGGVSGTESGRTTATGGNPGGPAGRN